MGEGRILKFRVSLDSIITMKLFRLVFLALCLICTTSFFAAEPFAVKNIRIDGLHGVSRATVNSYLPIKVGQSFTTAKSEDIIRTLYETGFFQDVRLFREGDTLIIKVVEMAVLSSVDISGNKSIKKDKIKPILSDLGLVRGHVYKQSSVDQFKQALLTVYAQQGRYSVKIDTKLVSANKQHVSLQIKVKEGPIAKVKSIEFVGNHEFSSTKLAGEMSLTTYRFLGFLNQ